MTECKGGPAQELAEPYLTGGLTEAESERFEDHYFSCTACCEFLMDLQAIRDGLSQAPLVIADGANSKPASGRLIGFPQRWMMVGAIAAGLVFAAVLVGVMERRGGNAGAVATAGNGAGPAGRIAVMTSPSAGNPSAGKDGAAREVEMASLADLQLPKYHAPQLRGADGSSAPSDATDTEEAAFKTGMASYGRGDCAGALTQLAKVPVAVDRALAAALYSGLCEMRVHAPTGSVRAGGDMSRAQADFNRVIAAGDSAELETAEYYLAQTMLLRGDETGARSLLTKTIALHGDYEERARREAARLTAEKKAGIQ